MKSSQMTPSFLEVEYLKPASLLLESGHTGAALLLLTQSVEVMGALLDNKPLKARGQSKKRFSIAFKKLFPALYSARNTDDWLYENLRNHLVHTFTSGGKIRIISNSEDDGFHLKKEDQAIHFSAFRFLSDCQMAISKLEGLLLSKEKK